MTHEPECIYDAITINGAILCICEPLRAAYRRGRQDGKATVHDCGAHSMACCTAGYRRGYTDGYNAHARAAQHWQDTHGAYRIVPSQIELYRQHGNGENP